MAKLSKASAKLQLRRRGAKLGEASVMCGQMVANWPKRAVSLPFEFQLGVTQGKGVLGLLVTLWG